MSEVGNIKNGAIQRDFVRKRKVECKSDGLVPLHSAICLSHVSHCTTAATKSEPGHTKCACQAKAL